MKKTWMPLTAGILEIVAGAIYLIVSLVLLMLGLIGGGLVELLAPQSSTISPGVPFWIFTVIAIPLIILGVLAVVGGTFALRARNWGWALTGAIISLLTSWVLGIPAIIFTVLSKDEFE